MVDRRALATAAGGIIAGFVGAAVASTALSDDSEPIRATNFISSDVLVDATVIEMHGYGPDGQPGTFLYDCSHDDEKLVCTQRDPEQP